VDPKPQVAALKAGVDVVTGTVARTVDHLEAGRLDLSRCRFFVLDEADRLLDTGNRDEILKVFHKMPKTGSGDSRLQVLLFSATLHSPEIRQMAEQLCQNPTLVDLKGRDSVPDTVHHVMVKVSPAADKSWLQQAPQVPTDGCHALEPPPGPDSTSREAMSEALKRLKPRVLVRVLDAFGMEQVLVFCRTNHDCDNLERFLNGLGGGKAFRGKAESGKESPYSCVVLAGARSVEERRRALRAFKEGDVRILICTDVAARGIDIKELPYVVNMTLPDADQIEDYVHRIGRVGRADTMGLAISLVADCPEKVWFCKKKGYRPWLEPNKQNTKTNGEGGHTKWYDEPKLLKLIEGRLKQPVEPLKDLSLPDSLRDAGGGSATVYGQQRGNTFSKEAAQHVEALRPTVASLADLEIQAQHSFLGLKSRWT